MTKKKLSKEHLEKLKKGRQKKGEETGLVCTIGNDIEVWADAHQFILRMNGCANSYFANLTHIMDELLERKIKELAVKNQRNDLIGVQEAIAKAQEWLEKQVKSLLDHQSSIHSDNKS